MYKICRCGSALMLVLLTSNSRASIVIENFESGSFPSGWTITGATGTSWKVGGATGTSPNILPPEGSYFARSGEPNSSTEGDTGTLTSPAYTVGYTELEWLLSGWSGGDPSVGNGANYFQILDHNLLPKAQIDTAQSDGWEAKNVNLLSIGLLPGATFYFRAVDGRNETNYGWMGFDELKLTGTQLTPGAVPEATSFLIWGVLGLTAASLAKRRREVEESSIRA